MILPPFLSAIRQQSVCFRLLTLPPTQAVAKATLWEKVVSAPSLLTLRTLLLKATRSPNLEPSNIYRSPSLQVICRPKYAGTMLLVHPSSSWSDFPLMWPKDVVSYTLSGADNERFLEHFRYIIIASQLLNDHVGPSSSLATPIGGNTLSSSFAGISVSTNGAIVVASLSFAFALLVHWARGGSKAEFHIERLSILLSVTAIIALVSYAYATRKWMQFLRRQAIDAASALVVTAQALESSSSSVFTMIQEVELVARGYSM